MYYKTGEKPGKGKYECTYCSKILTLDEDTDTLPPCSGCFETTFKDSI